MPRRDRGLALDVYRVAVRPIAHLVTRKRSALLLIAALSGILLVNPAAAQAGPPSWNDLTHGALRTRSAHPKLASNLDDSSAVHATKPRRDSRGRVSVSIAGNDLSEIAAAVARAGGEVQLVAPNSTLAVVDPSNLPALSDDPAVVSVDVPRRLRPDVVTSEGVDDFNTSNRVGSTSAHTWQVAGRTGSGTSVAIVDVGFAQLPQEEIAGQLPPDPQITKINHCGSGTTGFDGSGPSGNLTPIDHGTAVAEIVHQMAPDATLTLICVFQSSDVALAEQDINAAHIPIVNMSLGDTLNGRGDGTGAPGSMAAAVALGRQHGELWTVSAGNSAQRHLMFPGRDVDGDGAVEIFFAGHSPGPDSSELATFSLNPGNTTDIGIKWDAWPTTSQEFDICMWQETVTSGSFVGCWSNNQAGAPKAPTDRLVFTNSTGGFHNYWIGVFAIGNPNTNRIDLYFDGEENSQSIMNYSVAGSLTEPATSPNVLTAGAHCFANASVEPFSSAGPTIDGRMKPDLTGPDGISSHLPDFGAASINGSNNCTFQSGFYGTSSAAPHTAGAAALVKGQFPNMTNDQIKNFLVSRAVAVGPPADPNQAGAGKLDLGSLLSLPQHDPTGQVDVTTRVPTGARLQGWTIDPDTSASVSVQVYDNGAFAGNFPASSSRPDVGSVFPDYGSAHGFDFTLPLAAGNHQICVNGVNASGTRGAEHFLRCTLIVISGTPFGSLDAVVRAPGGLRFSGWSIDPDTSSPNSADSVVDGVVGTRATANVSRPDVAVIYPDYGALHGFGAVVPVGPGTHTACSYGLNSVGSGANALLGCLSVNVSSDPFGSLDTLTRIPGGYQVAGWSIDPDVAGAIQVHVYIDGGGTNLGLASNSRPDVGQVFPDWGANHGYSAAVGGGTSAGGHSLCVYGINTGPGNNTTLRCVNLVVSGDPFGQIDSIGLNGGTVTANGWAIDPDTSSSIQVQLLVDGAGVISTANGDRPDVGGVFPAYGAAHGYSASASFPVGTHTACVYALNAAAPGNTTLFGCRSFTR